MEVAIPGYGELRLEYLVMDYNGTLAIDGRLIDGAAQLLRRLSETLTLHVLTADTFGIARAGLEGLPCELTVLPKADQRRGKLDFVERLGAGQCAAVGNGRNDQDMLKRAALGIAVMLEEGTAVETLMQADIVCPSIVSALELLANPLRLTATLRS
ncbi:MAG TPA: ATPase P [Desulfosalsimonadaceae bacterium]|nr:ATPase P [Desulfosalsimonadaceae bacterium]